MAEFLSTLSVISFAAGAVFFLIALFLFFLFKIPLVIGDLSGRTAKKTIAKIRAANEKSAGKGYHSGRKNYEKTNFPNGIHDLEKQNEKDNLSFNGRPETGLLAENKAEEYIESSTQPMEEETAALLTDEDETVPLENIINYESKIRSNKKKIDLIEEIIIIHTEEAI